MATTCDFTKRKAECALTADQEQTKADGLAAQLAKLQDVIKELTGTASTLELYKLQLQAAQLQAQIDQQAQTVALLACAANQCDDDDCKKCWAVLVRVGVYGESSVVELTDARKKLIADVEALAVSDEAKKHLLLMRWV